MMTFEAISKRLSTEPFDHVVVLNGPAAAFLRIPATGTPDDEWICVTPSDGKPGAWLVVLYNPGHPVVSELHRLRSYDWMPDHAVDIIREHLAARASA